MTNKLLARHHLEFLSLSEGCTDSSESTRVKMPHCWKAHVAAQLSSVYLLTGSEIILRTGHSGRHLLNAQNVIKWKRNFKENIIKKRIRK